MAIKGGPIPSLGGNTKGTPWKGTSQVVVPDEDAICKLSNNPLTATHKKLLLKLKETSKHVKGVDKSQEPHRIGQKDNLDGLRIPKRVSRYTQGMRELKSVVVLSNA